MKAHGSKLIAHRKYPVLILLLLSAISLQLFLISPAKADTTVYGGSSSLPSTCTAGQVATFNATTNQWTGCADLAGGGDMLKSIYDVGSTGKIDAAAGGTGLATDSSTGFPKIVTGTWSIRSAADMRTDLGLAIGTNVQAYDADLTTWAGITPSANIQTLLGSADFAAARTNLGLAIGTNVQAYDADLTTWAGITPSANMQTWLASANLAAMKAGLSVDDLVTLSGVADGEVNLGEFTGSTITDNQTIKAALQLLETAVEARLLLTGGTLSGKLITKATASGAAGLNIPHGTKPDSAVNGDCWTTTAGLYCQINGSEQGPFTSTGGTGYATVQEEGGNLTQRTIINFVGGGFTAADDAGNTRTNISLDADLNTIAGLSVAQGKVLIGSASPAWVVSDFTMAGGTNTFSITNGSASLSVAAGKTVNFSGTFTDGYFCNFTSSGSVIGCNVNPAAYALLAGPTLTGIVTVPDYNSGVAGLVIGSTALQTNATRLNYLSAAGGTTGTTSTNIVYSTSPTLVTPNLGTPTALTLTNATGLPISGITGLGTGVGTALAVNIGSAGSPVVLNGALGTPSSGTLTNATGLPIATGVSGLGSGVATFLATPSGANLASALSSALPATKGGTGLTSLGTNVATALGNAINGASGIVALDSSSRLPAVDGSQLTGIPGTISGLTTNTITKATAATTIGNSLLIDNGTTLTYSGAGGISAAGFTTAKSSGVAGAWKGYEANSTDTDGIGWMGPASVLSSHLYQFSNTAPTAGQVMAFAAPSGTGGPGGEAVSAQTWIVPALSSSYANQVTVNAITSGGLLYGSAANTVSSTSALTDHGVVIMNGAGNAPTVAQSDTATYSLFARNRDTPAFRAIATSDLPTVTASKGGTGVANNDLNTITFAGGNYSMTFTLAGNTNVTYPTAGTLAILGANAFTGAQTFTGSGGLTSPPITTDIRAAAFGAATVGTAALPFSHFYMGASGGTYYFDITGTPGTSNKTLTVPNVTGTFAVAATSTTATQAMFATATAGAPEFRAIATADLPAALPAASTMATSLGVPLINLGTGISLTGGAGVITFTDLAGTSEVLALDLRTADTAKLTTTSGVATLDIGAIALNTTGIVSGGSQTPVIGDADVFDDNCTGACLYGGTFIVNAAGTVILPNATVGMNFTIVLEGAVATVIEPLATGTDDTIVLNGIALTQGHNITSSTQGAMCVFQYRAADSWMATCNGFVDGT